MTARIGVITFPGTLDDVDAARAVRVSGAEPVELWHADADLKGVDALVLSACVQMPSLAAVDVVERMAGVPVVSAATCTAHQLLTSLGLKAVVPNAGELLSGKYAWRNAA